MVGILAGFNVTRIATTADVTVTTSPAYVVARLSAGAAAAVMSIFNGTTNVANKVAELSAGANLSDETAFPIRCKNGVRVQMSVVSAEGFVGIR